MNYVRGFIYRYRWVWGPYLFDFPWREIEDLEVEYLVVGSEDCWVLHLHLNIERKGDTYVLLQINTKTKTPMCVSTVYSVLSRALRTQSQAYKTQPLKF